MEPLELWAPSPPCLALGRSSFPSLFRQVPSLPASCPTSLDIKQGREGDLAQPGKAIFIQPSMLRK